MLAREHGYDAIWGVDRMAPEFTEYVGLNRNAFAQTTTTSAAPAANRVAQILQSILAGHRRPDGVRQGSRCICHEQRSPIRP